MQHLRIDARGDALPYAIGHRMFRQGFGEAEQRFLPLRQLRPERGVIQQ
jgi:hypothetical protein